MGLYFRLPRPFTPLVLILTAILLQPPPAQSADKTQEMVRLLSEHLEAARATDGNYLAAVATKEAAWQEYQRATALLGISVTASATSFS